nr:hypothetical protein [Anaerolineaceae bacterium]
FAHQLGLQFVYYNMDAFLPFSPGAKHYQGLVMPVDERRKRSEGLRWIIEKEDIHDWFCKQLNAVERLIK